MTEIQADDRIEKAVEKMREMRAAGWKPTVLNPVEKAKSRPTSLKLAIRAHCWVCCGGDGDSGVKIRVRECGLKDKCSLWPHRPWQKASGRTGEADDSEAIHEHDDDDDDAVEDVSAGDEK